jgi:alanine-glyoxylate transaminase / serine-glyoxylate transaminase / serine-pyruvate transaminase
MSKINLMVPGPVEVDHAVLEAMGTEQIAHYHQDAIDIYNSCVEKMRQLFHVDKTGHVFILPGSGSVALDVAVGSLVAAGDKVITGVNGTFSARVKSMVEAYGGVPVETSVPHGKMIRPEMVEEAINNNPDAVAICIAHLETSTGVMNPIKEIGEIAAAHTIPLAVDAVSSIGIEDFRMEEWKVAVCSTASQKGLETPPGLGMVCVSERGWSMIRENSLRNNGWFSDLLRWKQTTEGNEIRKGVYYPLPVTMPVNNVLALDKSLEAILKEGIENRITRHALIAEAARTGMRNCGFELFPEPGSYSSVETVLANTHTIDINAMIQFIVRRYNTEISNGLFDLYNKMFRIGHIGQTATSGNLVPVLFGVEQYLRSVGIEVSMGASLTGVEALTI